MFNNWWIHFPAREAYCSSEWDVDGKSNEAERKKNTKQSSLIKTMLEINQTEEEKKRGEKKQEDIAAVWGHENIWSDYSL